MIQWQQSSNLAYSKSQSDGHKHLERENSSVKGQDRNKKKKKKREGRREEELKEKTGDRIQKNYPKRIAAKILHRVLVDQGVERKGESDSNLY